MAGVTQAAAATGLIANAIIMAVPMMPALAPAAAARPVAGALKSTSVVVSRTTDGLFHVDGASGTGSVDLIVDTGATLTILTSRDARRLSARTFIGRLAAADALQTVGGRTVMTHSQIDDLVIAGQHVGPVQVAVVDGGLDRSLLGQDVLSRLGRIVIADDRLMITPAASS